MRTMVVTIAALFDEDPQTSNLPEALRAALHPKGHSRSFKQCANHIRSILMNKRALSRPAYKNARGGDGIRDQPLSAVAALATEPSFCSALWSLRCDGLLDSLQRA